MAVLLCGFRGEMFLVFHSHWFLSQCLLLSFLLSLAVQLSVVYMVYTGMLQRRPLFTVDEFGKYLTLVSFFPVSYTHLTLPTNREV